MKRGMTSLVLGGMLIFGMVGCSDSARPVQEVSEMKVVKKSESELKEDYMKFITEQNSKAQTSMNNVARLFDKATMHPELLSNEGFQADLEKEYDEVGDVYFALKMYKEADVPQELLFDHQDLILGYEKCYNGNNLTFDGVKELNTKKMKDGARLIGEGASYVRNSGLDKTK